MFWGLLIYCVFKLWNFFFSLSEVISVYFQISKMECEVKRNHLLFALNQSSKAENADNFYSGDFCQRGIKILLNVGKKL